MEVHHHSHSERKKWTHYFWEFLMLFLAVLLGFLVENQREHYIEHKREVQFITTLVEDLKSDTAQLSVNIEYKRRREILADSLIQYLSAPDHTQYGSSIYYCARNLTRPQYFFPNDRTIQQLKNSGSLRMIRKLAVSDSIMFYDQQLRYLQLLYDDERAIRNGVRDIFTLVFDGKVLYSQIDSIDIANYKRPAGNPSLLLQDQLSVNKVIASVQFLRTVLRGIRVRQEYIQRTAARLISFLQEEYRLE